MACTLTLGVSRTTPKLLSCFCAPFDGSPNHRFSTNRTRWRTLFCRLNGLVGNAFLPELFSKASFVLKLVQLSFNHFLQHYNVAINELLY